jgi:tetratricopeptide (TPR) repeat protein
VRIRNLILGVILAAALGVSAWLGWRWYTTPDPPTIAVDQLDPPVAALVEDSLAEVRRTPRSGPAWGKLGMVLYANYLYGPAMDCFLKAERFDRVDPRWPYLRGKLLKAGKPQEAIPELRQALARAEADYARATILFELALVLIEDGQLDEAGQHLAAQRTLDADTPQLHLGLGLLALARGERAAAREHLQTLSASPFARKAATSLLATLTDDRAEALRYRQLAAELPNDMPWPDPIAADTTPYAVNRGSRTKHVFQLLRAGRHAEALQLSRDLVAEAPDADNYFVLANTLSQLQQHDEAIQLLRTLSDKEPKNSTAHWLLGEMLFARGLRFQEQADRKKEATELFRAAVTAEDRALAVQSDLAAAHLTRGRALLSLGQNAEAISALRRAAHCRPDSVDAYLYLGETLAAQGETTEALECLENAARLAAPNDSRPRDALARWRGKDKS